MAFHLVGGIILVICIIWQLWNLTFTETHMSDRLKEWQRRGNEKWINNQKIFFIYEAGEGTAGTVICLHGFPTSSYDWIEIIPQLKKEFSQILLLDFLGFGFSDKPIDHTYSIFEQAHFVETLASILHISSAHILAHDYGDTVALELLARHNELRLKFEVQSLTMLNGGIFQEIHKPRLVQKLLLMPVVGFLTSQLFNYPMFALSFGQIFGANKPTEEDNQDFWALICYNDGYKASYKVINFLRERQTYKTRWVGALVKTQIKVLFIYGPADPVNPPEFIKIFKQTVPGQTIVTLSQSVGHYPQWESPKEVVREIITFLKPLLLYVDS